jgi:chromosome segregation ATPase
MCCNTMDHFSPGIRAFRRFAARLEHRVLLYFAQRDLAKAETELGLLGWQQAEFDPVTQKQVDALQHVEREQAELSNRSAEIAYRLKEVIEQRKALKEAFERDVAALAEERTRTGEPVRALREQIAKLQEPAPATDKRLAELQSELREAEKVYNRLLQVQPQTPEVRDDILKVREELLVLPREQNELKAHAARRASEIQSRQEQIAAVEKAVDEVERRIRERKALFGRQDEELAKVQRDHERDKLQAEKENEQLERAKIDPYREIGIVLADNSVAPMNQPQALERALECRAVVLSHQQSLIDIEGLAAAEDRTQVQMSVAIWGAIFLTAALICTALW